MNEFQALISALAESEIRRKQVEAISAQQQALIRKLTEEKEAAKPKETKEKAKKAK